MTVLLDTHVLHWWSAEPEQLSPAAAAAVEGADELAWLATHERILLTLPVETWLAHLARDVRTVGIGPSTARTAVELPSAFAGDPADRLIYATAVEHGWHLVSKDRRMCGHPYPRDVVTW